MRYLKLDTHGRLIEFGAVPPAADVGPPTTTPVDWTVVFRLAGLELSTFSPVASEWTPASAVDQRGAWTGAFPEQPDIPLRIEAAAWRGKLVSFRTIGPWDTADPDARLFAGVGALFIAVLLTGTAMAWTNARAGRGDRRGALRVAAGMFVLSLMGWALNAHHMAAREEISQFRLAISLAVFGAATVFIAYMAIEPHVRRRWPAVLVGWTRLIGGRIRDPLVGREVLAGVTLGSLAGLFSYVIALAASRTMDVEASFGALVATGRSLAPLIRSLEAAVSGALLMMFLALAVRLVVRNVVVTAIVVAVIAAGSAAAGSWWAAGSFATIALFGVTALTRFGLVAVVAFLFTNNFMQQLRAGLALDVGTGLMVFLPMVALVAAAAYVAMGRALKR
jgi:hypothetical protein